MQAYLVSSECSGLACVSLVHVVGEHYTVAGLVLAHPVQCVIDSSKGQNLYLRTDLMQCCKVEHVATETVSEADVGGGGGARKFGRGSPRPPPRGGLGG